MALLISSKWMNSVSYRDIKKKNTLILPLIVSALFFGNMFSNYLEHQQPAFIKIALFNH